MHDVGDAKERRRFYLERGMRKRPLGTGSDTRFLMGLQRREIVVNPSEVFGDIPVLVAGGVATRAYMPERHTNDTDFLVEHANFDEACRMLRNAGFTKNRDLFFPNAHLGLYRSAWTNGTEEVDIMSSPQEWCAHAFRGNVNDQTGLRVIPLPYLVLMKFDAARGVDQGDLTRMLGPLPDEKIEAIAKVVALHSGDPGAADEIRQYAQLGRWELGRDEGRSGGR